MRSVQHHPDPFPTLLKPSARSVPCSAPYSTWSDAWS